MQCGPEQDHRQKVWDLIKEAHSALLVTIGTDGKLDSRPMGCLQKEFDDTLWFLTFRHSRKLQELAADDRMLVSYADPAKYEYVSISGRGKFVEDKKKVRELWTEALKVWFPNGPDDPELAVLSIDVEEARYWTNAASVTSYAWSYLKARVTGRPASADEVIETKTVQF
jgi:general stress protein 26